MNIVLSLIRLYQSINRTLIAQGIFSPISGCRQWPTCSEFALQAIQTKGVVAGTTAAVRRFLRCNPLASSLSHVH